MGLITPIRELWHIRWGKLAVTVVLLLATLGLLLTLLLSFAFARALERRSSFRAKLEALKARNVAIETTRDILDRSGYRILDSMSEHCLSTIDSLGLSAQVRGYVVKSDLRPHDFLLGDSAVYRVDVFADCGCSLPGIYDIISLDVDPTSLRSRVLRVTRHATLEEYKTLSSEEGR